MRLTRDVVLWPLAAAGAIAAGTVTVIAAGPRPDVLTAQQAADRLAAARESPKPLIPPAVLGKGEWAGLLPSADVVARCTPAGMQLVRWSGPGLQDVRPGPAATVSGKVSVGKDQALFTGRCVDGLPTGTYRWKNLGEGPQDIRFGKWVADRITVSCGDSDQKACGELPIMMLSTPPQPQRR